jgi:hypothetical protein
MPSHRLSVAWVFYLLGVLLAHAADAPLPPEVQHRLEALKTSYEAFDLKSSKAPYLEAIKALNASVKPVLERVNSTAVQQKDLDALVRIKSDSERIGKGQVLTAADTPPPPALKSVYATYQLELDKLQSAQKASCADARQRYDKGLAQLQDELTTQQKLEAALHVKQLREALVNAPTAPPVAGTPDMPAPSAIPQADLTGRWVFKVGAFNMEKELRNDGTIVSVGYALPGTWKIQGTKLRVEYSNGAWAEFKLPLKDGKLQGRSNKDEAMVAEKK